MKMASDVVTKSFTAIKNKVVGGPAGSDQEVRLPIKSNEVRGRKKRVRFPLIISLTAPLAFQLYRYRYRLAMVLKIYNKVCRKQ